MTGVSPAVSFAALDGIRGLLIAFGGILNQLIRITFGLALVFFFWGLAQFILRESGEPKAREEGKKKMLWGIIAIFVMVSIYGILNLISGTLGIPLQGGNVLPSFPINGQVPLPSGNGGTQFIVE